MVSDQDLIVSLFNMVGALAERLTGERLVVAVRDSEGNTDYVCASSYPKIQWVQNAPAACGRQVAPFLEPSSEPTIDDTPNLAHAIAK